MSVPQQPGPPYAPPAAGRGRTPLVIVLSVLLGAALATSGFLLLSHKTPTPAPLSAPAEATATGVTAVDTTPAIPLEQQVDIVVNSDGVPLQLDHEMYTDAYAMIQDDCSTMADPGSGQDASEWLAAHLLNASVPGEAQALRLGIPLVCPQFSADLLQVAGK